MTITEFLNDHYKDSALYMNYRNTPSYIDGFKCSGRKCLYTSKKRNLKSEIKVSNFAGSVIDESNYLHGNTSMEGSIVTLSRKYCGSNNIPIFEGIGSFGTRHIPEAAASRYIFIKPTDYTDLIFKKCDDDNLVSQEFEGDEIEPVYYVPTIPMLLINGSVGIGVGFSSTILNRSAANMIKAIRAKLENKPLNNNWFIPNWRGFKGTVKELEPGKWAVKGVFTRVGKKVTISEIPIKYDLLSYIEELKKLKEEGYISKYVDYSVDDNFSFEVTLSEDKGESDDDILKKLKLIDVMTENLTCIDESNAIKEYTSISDIFEDYYNIKIASLKDRIKSEIKKLSEEESALNETYKFIKEVIKGTINLKLKKAEVEETLKTKGYTIIDRLLAMPLYSITEDKAKEIEAKWKEKKLEIANMKKETPENLWSKDLSELEKVLSKNKLL